MTSDHDLHAELLVACAAAGIDPSEARLLHHYSNAIYHLPAANTVVRITEGPADLQRVQLTQSITSWLVQACGFPATAPLASSEPVRLRSGAVASFWEYHQQPDQLKYNSADLAALLHRLHTIENGALPVGLAAWVPLTSLENALEEQIPEALLSADEVAWLNHEILNVRAQLAAVDWQLPPGLIHGDAWAGNLLADSRSSSLLLGDWDWVGIGPREVDLIPTWHAVRRYGRDTAWQSAFAAEYGYELADSPGFEILMHMRDMVQLTGPLRRAEADERYFAFLRQRYSDIRRGDRASEWLTF